MVHSPPPTDALPLILKGLALVLCLALAGALWTCAQ
jgi:hypothetical protein